MASTFWAVEHTDHTVYLFQLRRGLSNDWCQGHSAAYLMIINVATLTMPSMQPHICDEDAVGKLDRLESNVVNHGQPNTVAGLFVPCLVKLGIAFFALSSWLLSLIIIIGFTMVLQTRLVLSTRQIRATIVAAVSNLSTAYNLVNVNLTNVTYWHSTGPGSCLTTHVLDMGNLGGLVL